MTWTKYPGKITGIETEGELAGELVCPTVNLWAIDKNGARKAVIRKIDHDTPIYILAEREGIAGERLLLVRSQKYLSVKGWITERFVIRDGEGNNVGAEGV